MGSLSLGLNLVSAQRRWRLLQKGIIQTGRMQQLSAVVDDKSQVSDSFRLRLLPYAADNLKHVLFFFGHQDIVIVLVQ